MLIAKAGGFDIENDVRKNHGPLGALYPVNTNRPQKEGDTMTFLYFLPAGMSNADDPTWGSWAGRHGLQENAKGCNYYWANKQDSWLGSASRDNTLLRWAVDIQNNFKARMDWCVKSFSEANHAPIIKISGTMNQSVKSGQLITLDVSKSFDPDGDSLEISPFFYPEASDYREELPAIEVVGNANIRFKVPAVKNTGILHLIVSMRDRGAPQLAGYQRIVFYINP